MHSRVLYFIWRKKFSILLVTTIIFLIAIWSWAIYNTTYTAISKDSSASLKDHQNGGKDEYLLEKLFSQINNIIQNRGASFINNRSNGVKFLKPTGIQSTSRRKSSSIEAYIFEEERLKMMQTQQRAQKEAGDDKRSQDSSAEKQSQYETELQRMGVPIIAGIGPGGPRPPNHRLVHLDLKGAPPKLTFLKRILPIIKMLGATGILMEYEDMFPYTGTVESISATNAFKPDELKDFLSSVAHHGLTIMPLVQTFGHLEHALKLQSFEHMREVPDSPQSICPSQKISINFIEDIVTQIVEFHLHWNGLKNQSSSTKKENESDLSNFSHIHIGCDEVYRMGECPRCILKSRSELFLDHVITVAGFIKAKWPHLKVVIWDDMLREMTLSDMQNSNIGAYVEPMIWVYVNDIYKFIQPHLWDKYSKVFPTAWAASAFKGAFGETLIIPPVSKHLENNMRWLAVIAKEGTRFSREFQGIALTGWQRYDHFATLCELLPTSMPSLMVTLSTISKGYFCVDPKENFILHVLECPNRPDSRRSGRPWIEFHSKHYNQLFAICTYPGSTVYKQIYRLNEKLIETRTYLTNVNTKSAWMADYNIRHNFSSPNRVRDIISNTPRYIEELTTMAKDCYRVMEEIYEQDTITEFVEQLIYPLILELRKHDENGRILMARRIWPRRPLPYDRNMTQLELTSPTKETTQNN